MKKEIKREIKTYEVKRTEVNSAKSFFNFNFSCEPMFWNESTGTGDWGKE